MAYTDNHCDLNKIKDKPIAGFSIRQVLSFVAVAVVDIPVYAMCISAKLDNTLACLLICLISVPIFFAGTYEDVHGRYLEKILMDKLRLLFLTQANRPFATDNRYEAIKKQRMLEEKYEGFVMKEKRRRARKAKKKDHKGKVFTFRKRVDKKRVTA
jgi:hypothetical protein